MGSAARSLGAALVAVSLFAVVQTIRELLLWERGRAQFADESVSARPISFAGRTWSVTDNQPFTPGAGYTEFEGAIQPTVDGRPLGMPSRAKVRRGLADLGRYHRWYDAWLFRERGSGQRTLWLARRLQAMESDAPRFELVTISEAGEWHTQVLRSWQLCRDYPTFRATQFVREGTSWPFPLALDGVIGFFPILLLIFPLGTLVLGVFLLARRGKAQPLAPAV